MKKIFKKKEKDEEKVIQVDENGNPIDEKKKVNVKGVVKNILVGAGCVALGAISFIAIGAAMNAADGDGSSDSIDYNDSIDVAPPTTNNAEPASEE